MRRREFITLVGSVAAGWPLAARSQGSQPVVGNLAQGSPDGTAALIDAVRKGLAETGLVEGKDYAGEFRWARGNDHLLPALAVELVQHKWLSSSSSILLRRRALPKPRQCRYRFCSQSGPIRCRPASSAASITRVAISPASAR